jgi:hypothetical protein
LDTLDNYKMLSERMNVLKLSLDIYLSSLPELKFRVDQPGTGISCNIKKGTSNLYLLRYGFKISSQRAKRDVLPVHIHLCLFIDQILDGAEWISRSYIFIQVERRKKMKCFLP